MTQTTISSRPLGRGKLAADHLESVGLAARVPTLRSSDFNYPCDFSYYLERRLGLSPAFSEQQSAAMCRGSWHHTRLEVVDAQPTAIREHMDRALALRVSEIKTTAQALGIADSYASRMVETARDDRDASWAQFEAALTCTSNRFPALAKGILPYMVSPKGEFRILAREARFVLPSEKDSAFQGVTLVVQPDILVFEPIHAHNTTPKVWIVDFKTTQAIPLIRARTYPIEWQPRHYAYVISQLLKSGWLQTQFGLPESTILAGFKHIIVQVPALVFGEKDRPYYLHSIGKKTKIEGYATFDNKQKRWLCFTRPLGTEGWPPKDNPEATLEYEPEAVGWLQTTCGKLPDKVHSGEKSIAIYRNRCIEWYNATGEYTHLQSERPPEHIPINVSNTPADLLLREDLLTEYFTIASRICTLAVQDPYPENFPRDASGMTNAFSTEPSPYADLFTTPIHAWPALARENHLLQRWRDEDILASQPVTQPRLLPAHPSKETP